MFAVGVRKGSLALALAVPLVACGGKSSEDGPRARAGAGGNAAGGAESNADAGKAHDPSGAGHAAGGVAASEGDVEPVSGAGPLPSGGGGSANEPGTPGSAGAPDSACLGEICQLAIDPTPLWVTELKGYGRGAAQIGFSDDAKLVRVGVGEYEYYVSTLSLATGELVGEPTLTRGIIASNASGSRTVSGTPGVPNCTAVVDGAEAFQFACGTSGAVRISSDGTVIANQYCFSEPNGVQLEAYDSESGELLAQVKTELPCFYGDLNVLVDTERRRTLFGLPGRAELFVFDWDSETVDTRSVHQAAPVSNHSPYNREGTILNLSLSPDGQRLVSIGAADGLAFLEPDSLAVESRLPDVPFFNVYDNCYTTYLDESPVAWSRAGEIFATARAGGGIALREVATQKELGYLDPPTAREVLKSACSSEFGPVLMDFSPDMRNLVVLYPNHASAYSLSGHSR